MKILIFESPIKAFKQDNNTHFIRKKFSNPNPK